MLVEEDYVTRENVVYATINEAKQQVLDRLLESGYRCIPVLDEDGHTYAGNIYKVHLLSEQLDNQFTGSIEQLVADQNDGFVYQDNSFVKVFSSIKKLPFLGVVDRDKHFLGILTNGNILEVLENAWGVHNGSYSLTIGTIEYSGALQRMLRGVNKYCNVQSVISLNNNSQFVRRVCIVLPDDVDERLMRQVVEELEKLNFTVTDIENL
ncbi:cyclic di-AMP binding protein CbpA [Barrientosiimonas marina]|uniref:Cyclic di-AMP binding protein CbpA n=1 Tax=Lentibacillus kimchii TaxID=1542911 RepID=A0ABW2UUU7_9BACI